MKNSFCYFNDQSHTFVIAECGSNWKVGTLEDDMRMAKELIEIASKSGADAIKFQTFRAETVYAPNAGQINYLEKKTLKNINDLFKNLAMPYEMIEDLFKHCKKHKIMFMSTPFSVEDAKQVNPYVEIHKVSSYEINHIRLLEFLAKTEKQVLISTGASTYDEIDFAVNLMKNNLSGQIGLLQCTAKYPAPIDSLNISTIPKLKEKYNVPVGLSDHSVDPITGPLLAIGMGATVIEKHFTMDKSLPGPDHYFALDPTELTMMVHAIRNVDKAKGSGIKEVLNVEQELRRFATRSIQATRDIEKGEILKEGVNFDILRPGNHKRGLEPRFLDRVSGKKAKNTIVAGEGILSTDLE